VRFWDSSAVVPLLVVEESTAWARKLLRSDPRGLIWALSPVEVRSALSRRRRDGALTQHEFDRVRTRADQLFSALSHIVALEPVRERAIRLLDLHDLRAADALQHWISVWSRPQVGRAFPLRHSPRRKPLRH
jgi:predicted nucleic acid-binding protein